MYDYKEGSCLKKRLPSLLIETAKGDLSAAFQSI
ncbi:hypothetical protein SpiGrapes_0026 [Sphaerochaeta pleomorpha str. Grapes]|uniref:Uncharacterized protein n=1 Tax=Sphaerochaeta pleomorpha (strain ATCC BAA-1885 / DSM 22778 / Grapes) TaxID=158190 RepID=G8QSJ2_SPHPG|nr:hypothetical protein SpiGrapes_0026 [Sphaerochaeta pleomorpha str. Grapes]